MNFKWGLIALFLVILTACGADPGPQQTDNIVNAQEQASRNTVAATYTLSKNLNSGSVSEGQQIIFSLTTTNVPANTSVPFSISGRGITVNDIESMKLNGITVPVALRGNFIIGQEGTANYASLSLVIREDFTTEGTEILTVYSGNNLRSLVSTGILDTSTGDIIPPKITITDANSISLTESATITGTVSDNGAVTSVTWKNGLRLSGSATVTGNTWTANVALSMGSNTVTFTAIDSAKNKASINTVIFRTTTPDTTPPVITINSRSAISSTGNITITGIVTDDVAVKSLTWAVGNATGTARLSGATWTATIPLQYGNNIVTFTATDPSNNKSTTTATVTRLDTIPPVISILTKGTPDSTGLAAVTLAVSDNITVSSVTWVNSRGGSGSASVNGNNWSAIIPTILGDNVVTFTATDSSGNIARVSTTITRSPPPDTAPPTLTVTTTGTPNSNGVVSISGTATDNIGVVTVLWTKTDGTSGSASLSNPIGGTSITWSITNISLIVGDNVITLIVRDAAGNQSSTAVTINRPQPPDTTLPQIGVSSVGAINSSNQSVITGTATDNVGVTSVTWTNSLGGSGVATVTGTGVTTWTATVPLIVGNNVITFTARDAANNANTTSTSVVRDPPPDTTVPTVAVTEQSTISSSGQVSIGGTATDNVAVKSVNWTNDRGGSGSATLSNSSGGASITWIASNIQLQMGNNVITVEASDAANNKTITSVTINRPDTLAPNINVTKQGTLDSNFVTRIEGTASDNIGVSSISWTNSLGGSGYATLTGNTTVAWFADVPLLVGTNNINFIVSDASGNGNLSQVSVTRAPPADTTAPTIAVTNQGIMDANGIITVEGTALDNRGIMSVAWSNNLGGTGSATVSGTSSVTWSASNIQLKTGSNVITFTVSDTAGNQASTQITVAGPAGSGSTSFAKTKKAPRPVAKIEPVKPETVQVSGPPTPVNVPNCEIQMQRLMEQCRPQMMPPHQFNPQELIPEFRGVYSEKVIELSIPDPPEELHHCNLSMKIQAGQMGIPLKEHTVNGWWLVASFSGYEPHPNSPPGMAYITQANQIHSREVAYFYWARLLSENEIGVVPTGFKTKEIIKNKISIDTQIDTGLATLPYYWIAQFWGEQLPRSEEEPCGSNR